MPLHELALNHARALPLTQTKALACTDASAALVDPSSFILGLGVSGWRLVSSASPLAPFIKSWILFSSLGKKITIFESYENIFTTSNNVCIETS